MLSILTLLHTITRRSVLQKVRGGALLTLPLFVNTGFQVLFHSPPGVLFTFPSRYLFTIGHQVVFSLTWWSTHIPTQFLVLGSTLDTNLSWILFAYGLITLFEWAFQLYSAKNLIDYVGPYPSQTNPTGLGSSSFARRYLRNRYLLSFPPVT